MDARATRQNDGLVTGARYEMTDDFSPLTNTIAAIDGPILFFNIGFAKLTGDSYGPLIGTMLREADVERYGVAVMGDMDKYIGAQEVAQAIELAKTYYSDYTCIATDACVGKDVGLTILGEGMMLAGTGAGKNLPPVGDYLLKCVMCRDADDTNKNVLALTRISNTFVETHARRAVNAILLGLGMRAVRLAKGASGSVSP